MFNLIVYIFIVALKICVVSNTIAPPFSFFSKNNDFIEENTISLIKQLALFKRDIYIPEPVEFDMLTFSISIIWPSSLTFPVYTLIGKMSSMFSKNIFWSFVNPHNIWGCKMLKLEMQLNLNTACFIIITFDFKNRMPYVELVTRFA